MATSKPTPLSLLKRLSEQHEETIPAPTGAREFTIDELAREAGSTVRNVRAYQDRGLLPPPVKRGRTGIYSDVHLARLRILSKLLDRGYTIANIKDLLAAWEQGRDLNDILGLEVAVTSPWSEEAPTYLDYEELVDWFGDQITPEVLQKAVRLGYIRPEDQRLRVPSPRILHAGKELVEAGIPLESLLDEVNSVRGQINVIADGFVNLVVRHLIDKKYGDNALPEGEDVGKLADFIIRVRPLADMVVSAELARVLDKAINKVLVDRLANVLTHLEQKSED